MKQSTVGIQFPKNVHEQRSTSDAGKDILATSVSDIDPHLAQQIAQQKNWRQHYHQYAPALAGHMAHSSQQAEMIAAAGLERCQQLFQFIHDDKTLALPQAMQTLQRFKFHTGCIQGKKSATDYQPSITHKGQQLQAEALEQKIQHWLNDGKIEACHASDLKPFIKSNSKLPISDRIFVLLGAGSEIGPLKTLLAMGATVIAIARPNPEKWQQLLNSAAQSAGTLLFPIRDCPADAKPNILANHAGADLLTDTPEIAQWLNTFEQALNIGCYAYLDGEKHVRLSIAMDAIIQNLIDNQRDISISSLLTPTDVFVTPAHITQASMRQYQAGSLSRLLKRALYRLSNQRLFAPSIFRQIASKSGQPLGILDNLVKDQGPNYMLAKRIQRWRILDCAARGIQVSCNVAPACATRSVMSNRLFKAASRGSEFFGIEVFQPETANTLMTLQMLADLSNRKASLRGEQIFYRGANHGGAWRLGYSFRSLIPISLLIGLLMGHRQQTPVVAD